MRRESRNLQDLRVCVCTSYPAHAEPRAPRHAAWIAGMDIVSKVQFIDCAPIGAKRVPVPELEGYDNLDWQTHNFPTRRGQLIQLAIGRMWQRWLQEAFRVARVLRPGVLASKMLGMERKLESVAADVYFGHNIDMLLPILRVAKRRRVIAMFDSMEFHSDMGDAQSDLDKRLIHEVERRCLPQCALVTASSEQVALALAHEYRIATPLALYNTPEIQHHLAPKANQRLALYWRNGTVALGERGLEEALVALTRISNDITLHLQGHQPADGGVKTRQRIRELGITQRVVFHNPYDCGQAVFEASHYHIGLCLERMCSRNHELTVSNKIFDYHMAGLAVIASDLPGLRAVIDRSGGGLLFEAGSAVDLAAKIALLYQNPGRLQVLAAAARQFALNEGNRETERLKFVKTANEVLRSVST